jgi:hypothetical protein
MILIHLSAYGSPNPKGGIFFFGVQVDVEPLLLAHLRH